MPRVKGIFVSPSGQFIDAAVGFDDYVVEVVPPVVCKSCFEKYNAEPVLVSVELPVTEQQYQDGIAAAERLVTMRHNGSPISSLIAYTTIFRAMFPGFLEGRPPAALTIQTVYDATVELLNQLT